MDRSCRSRTTRPSPSWTPISLVTEFEAAVGPAHPVQPSFRNFGHKFESRPVEKKIGGKTEEFVDWLVDGLVV